MSDPITESIVALQTTLTRRMEELGFQGVAASHVVHHLAEIAVLARDLAGESVPLLASMSAEHRNAMVQLVEHIKNDLDQIRDAITDVEPDLIDLMKFLKQRADGPQQP